MALIALPSLVIGICLATFSCYLFADYFLLWQEKIKTRFEWNEIDLYWSLVCMLPILLGHFITIWGNYFRATSQFQHSISKVTTSTDKQQRISFWERHDSTRFGFTVKFWCLAALIIVMNIYWFVLTTILSRPAYVVTYGNSAGIVRAIAYGSSQAVLLDTSIILFLVLRRSMLHAIGFTYPEIIPLHRWLGVAMLIWSTIHAAFYSAYLIMEGKFTSDIAFSDKSRGTRNMPGVFAWIGVVVMSFFALPQFRRMIYPVFIYVHRAGTFVFFIGLIMHYPTYMLWYYMLPGFILFLVDRFVPKIIQARSIHPNATCAFNSDADIIRMKLTSAEPMKPYFPGDYITVQIPGLGQIHHPFTIASYWPEDPHSITLYIRVFGDAKLSWTHDLAKKCGNEDKRITVRANVDGVFGDRRHDYLKSETMIIFVAGAAITTFMALIKAIAAQIAVSEEPLRMQLHMICTFRTRSELHAYGSFLHQITRDPRFTSWLHVEIYVSRPDKPQTLMGAHAHVVKNDIMVPGQTVKAKKAKKNFLKRTGTKLKRALSGRTIVAEDEKTGARTQTTTASDSSNDDTAANSKESSIRRSGSVHTVVDLEDIAEEGETSKATGSGSQKIEVCTSPAEPMSTTPTRAMTYVDQPLPTFQARNSTTVATKWAKLDLLVTSIMIFVPLAAWCVARSVAWEGPSNWCPTTKLRGTYVTANCRWTYAMIPGTIQIVVASIAGYIAVWMARKVLLRRGRDVETGLPYPDFAIEDEKLSVEDGNWDEGDVVYSKGRLDVKKAIQGFVDAGVGSKDKGHGLVSVFGGGPEGFVEMIEKQAKAANWSVDFHRETWAP